MTQGQLRCALAAIQGGRRDPDTVRRQGWQEMGILAVQIDDSRLHPWERQVLDGIGRRLYGERPGCGGGR